MKLLMYSLLFGTLILSSACSFKPVNRVKNITYLKANEIENIEAKDLNVFAPKDESNNDVLVFIHGGSWNEGRKELYGFLGGRLAKKGIVTVIIDYPLAPSGEVKDMTIASAKSIKWVKENIHKYGGNPEQIFVSGHSAGGHLAAMVSMNDEYFDAMNMKNPIKGTILIDAGGIDMYSFLQQKKDTKDGKQYLESFTSDPAVWKEYSPIYHIKPNMLPTLIMVGGKTYPSITSGNKEFLKLVKEQGNNPVYFYQKNKKHTPMITQFIKVWSPAYDEVIGFMKKQRSEPMKPIPSSSGK